MEAQQLPVPDRFLQELERHLFLVYTGKTRLARDLLQNVLRFVFSFVVFRRSFSEGLLIAGGGIADERRLSRLLKH